MMLIMVCCCLTAAVNLVLVVRNRKPGLPLQPHWFESPFNYIFRPESLTDKGLRASRRTFLATFGYFVCAGLLLILSKMNLIDSR